MLQAVLYRLRRHRLRSDTRGVGAMEFALIVPAFCMILIGTIDVGSALFAQISLKSATQAGAQYLIANGMDRVGAKATVVQSSRLVGVRATPDPTSYCGCPNDSGVIQITCGSVCSNGKVPGNFVRVTAEYDYTNMLPYPGISRTYTLYASSSVRVE